MTGRHGKTGDEKFFVASVVMHFRTGKTTVTKLQIVSEEKETKKKSKANLFWLDEMVMVDGGSVVTLLMQSQPTELLLISSSFIIEKERI